MNEIPLRWILWVLVFFLTMRCLISISILLRDRLQGLLIEHVKKQQLESQKRQRILELREKIRIKKANAAEADISEKRAA